MRSTGGLGRGDSTDDRGSHINGAGAGRARPAVLRAPSPDRMAAIIKGRTSMTRIIGQTGSRRRRRFLIVPILLTAVLALLLVASASPSVHDVGVFQLDGNATDANTNPAGQLGDDWSNIFTGVGGSQKSHRVASTFDPDVTGAVPPVESLNATIFTGGG